MLINVLNSCDALVSGVQDRDFEKSDNKLESGFRIYLKCRDQRFFKHLNYNSFFSELLTLFIHFSYFFFSEVGNITIKRLHTSSDLKS